MLLSSSLHIAFVNEGYLDIILFLFLFRFSFSASSNQFFRSSICILHVKTNLPFSTLTFSLSKSSPLLPVPSLHFYSLHNAPHRTAHSDMITLGAIPSVPTVSPDSATSVRQEITIKRQLVRMSGELNIVMSLQQSIPMIVIVRCLQ